MGVVTGSELSRIARPRGFAGSGDHPDTRREAAVGNYVLEGVRRERRRCLSSCDRGCSLKSVE